MCPLQDESVWDMGESQRDARQVTLRTVSEVIFGRVSRHSPGWSTAEERIRVSHALYSHTIMTGFAPCARTHNVDQEITYRRSAIVLERNVTREPRVVSLTAASGDESCRGGRKDDGDDDEKDV